MMVTSDGEPTVRRASEGAHARKQCIAAVRCALPDSHCCWRHMPHAQAGLRRMQEAEETRKPAAFVRARYHPSAIDLWFQRWL